MNKPASEEKDMNMHDHSQHNHKSKHKNHEDHDHHDGHEHHGDHEHHGHNGGHDHSSHHKHMAKDFQKRFWISLVLTVPVLLLAPLIKQFLGLTGVLSFPGDGYVIFGLSTIIFIYGGYPFLKGFYKEVSEKKPGMMTLISLAILVAYVYSTAVVFGLPGKTFFWELATLIVVMLLGHWIEMKSVIGASKALDELAKLMPSTAHKQKSDGSAEDIPVSKLSGGDKVIVKPGEKIPADGKIVEGSSSINEALITGESEPVAKEKGNSVIGGAINGEGSITIEVEKTGKDSYLSQVMNLVQEAQSSKSKTQRLADRAALWLTVIAISAGIITFLVWYTAMGQDFVFALGRTVTVMVITCPHALGLAIPLVVAVSTAKLARGGILIRNRSPFERARKINAIVFDKTGTLTKGNFEVSNIVSFGKDYDDESILKFAASVESRSEHPIAKAIVEKADKTENVESFKSLTGKGAQGNVGGKTVKVVSRSYVEEENLEYDKNKIDESKSKGKTMVFVVIDGKVSGVISLEDPVRDESKEAIKRLHKKNIKTIILTGDNEDVAKRVADEIGVDEYFAEVLPDKKSDKIKEVQSRGMIVAMVGDGVNDAPALAQADVGIAIGAGTDVAIESADIILGKSNPLDVVRMIDFAGATYKKMIQNLIWATGYNVVAIPLAAGVLYSYGILMNPAVGALLMSLSTVIVAINARILKAPENQ